MPAEGEGVVMRRSRRAATGVVAAAVLLVGGCTASPGDSPSTGQPSTPPSSAPSTQSPTPEQTPPRGPTLDAPPPLADLVISPSGLGPLTVGAVAPAANPGAAMIRWDPAFCAGVVDDVASQGRWVASGYGDDAWYTGEPATPFYVAASDAGVQRIDVMGSSPRTAEGVRVGSTLEELEAAYPTLAGPFEGPISDVWWITEASGSIAFETQGDDEGMRPAGTAESVILIRVLAPDLDPAFATANSDDVAGGCL